MSSSWLIYSGALLVLLSVGILMVTGRPAMSIWRDMPSIAAGVVLGAAVCVIALVCQAPAQTAVSGACFWMAAAITGVHAVRGHRGA
ncbi:hypothetical protein GPA10_03865 [Streptomyces sp. p1417]|uniref:Uncharacterized protein n=1 Tax=Streptomyces typhae TaxID=2681492 RepID=A0A6L6WPA6_9ACTN|nr:hypothetical protein [Streptomyces typhae]MVO83923.1 hypothetical protein [Streptomyces typhae]